MLLKYILRKYCLLAIVVFLFGLVSQSVNAANYTVCASGCDYTSVNAALTAAVSGNDVVEVQGAGGSPYTPASETWPITFASASTTLTCSGGATIGQTTATGNNLVFLSTSSTVSGCNLGNISFKTSASTDPPPGIRIIGNTFSSSATGTIELIYGAQDFEIVNNTNINFMSLNATSTRGLIQGNTFYGRLITPDNASIMSTSVSSSRLRILSNTFTSYLTGTITASRTVIIDGFDQIFATNTIRYANTSPGTIDASLLFNASGTNYIAGNFIDTPSEVPNCNGIRITNASLNPWTSFYTVTHNTVRANGNCWNSFPILARNTVLGSTASSTLDFSYNLLFNSVTTTLSAYGITVLKTGSSIPFTQTNAYNGAYRMGGVVKMEITGVSATDVSAATSITTNSFLKVHDADTTNDLQTADFSPYLDVNGTLDIGATSASRRATIYLDDNGTIDYAGVSGVDATSTADISQFLRTGDTVNLAAGTYRAFSVNSSRATSSIAIVGAGASTIINARENEDAISFTSVSSSSISALYVRNASSTASSYTATRMNFAFGGSDYADAVPAAAISANVTLYFSDPVACELASYASDGTTVSSILGTGNIHIGLADIMGGKVTILTPNSVASNSSALQSLLDNECGGAGTVDLFISSVFTKSGDVYTYQSSAVSGASATIAAGVTNPPAITLNQSSYAGVKLAGTSNHITISSVTSTGNGYGISFATANNGYNTVSEGEFSGNTQYDIYSVSNATNTFDNTSFTRTSSTISGTGPVVVKFNARTFAGRSGSATAISSAAITATDAGSQATSLGSTASSGYTSYVSLMGYKLTSSSSALTNGGFNPYTISSSATNYAASSTSVTIASRNQLISLSLTSTAAPSAPTSPTVTKGVTTSTIAWTDNADSEANFIIDYINLSTGESFPGTLVTADADATSTTLTGLSPNITYQARVQATSTAIGSAHATTSAFTTYAEVPTAPTVTVASQTSVTITVNSNGNSTSTQYAIYHAAAGRYLDSSGANSVSPTWQTTSTWSELTVTGLTCGTSYGFSTIARNLDLVITSTSSAATVTTSACSSSSGSSSGGGGGGGLSAGSGSSSLLPVALPVSSSPNIPSSAPQAPVAPSVPSDLTPIPVVPPSARVLGSIQADVREFRLPFPVEAQERLASFVEAGTTIVTQRLGEGERRALVRDWLDTVGVVPSTGIEAVIADLERIASGQIPQGRNLTRERAQLPRVRQTFRTLYGRDPNFQNAQENLAWNTLMYRVRFTRDLQAERIGIQEFRATFRRAPQDPFQWATVRVMGYVQR